MHKKRMTLKPSQTNEVLCEVVSEVANIGTESAIPSDLLEPYKYLEQSPGKGIREQMIDAFNKWFRVPEPQLSTIKRIITMLHTASLMIDDIEDNSKMRRGIPATHLVYGVAATINCANCVYFQALMLCHRLGNPQAVQVFVEELLNLHRGQGYDILWRDQNTCPTEAEYRRMVLDKTGGLLRLAARLMAAFSIHSPPFLPLIDLLSLYYQIRDDYINLQSAQYMENKSYCEDLTEGKFSFPIIHAITSTPTDHRLLNILRRRPEDVETKRYAVELMKDLGSLAYTERILQQIVTQIREEIHRLGGNDDLERILTYLETHLL